MIVTVQAAAQQELQVVTGAKNLQPGLKVPLALPGALLPDGRNVAEGRFRGALSQGMLCSAEEVGLNVAAGQEAGILVLPKQAQLGEDVAETLNLGGWLLILEVTPDRPDCLSLIGIAREVAAAIGAEMIMPPTAVPGGDVGPEPLLKIKIADQDLCPRYAAGLIRHVVMKSSPLWLQQRLTAAGMRPINAVVDITNYVMLETGQPLHAFDYNALAKEQIIVRRARLDEALITLDGTKHRLGEQTLVIADADKPQALAGIMGGKASEISPATEAILLESATFNNINIRRTAQSLGIRTEASLRYERKVDPNGALFALHRCNSLFKQLGVGEIDFILDAYPRPIKPKIVSADTNRIRRLIGEPLDDKLIKGLLEKIELQVVKEGCPEFRVQIPTFRPDIEQEADLAEEVARLYGFDRIQAAPLQGRLQTGRQPRELKIETMVKNFLSACGLDEVQTYSMVDPESIAIFDIPAKALPLLSPLTSEQSVLRTILLPSLLKIVALNQRHKAQAVNIFEISRTYLPHALPLRKLPAMPRCLGIVLAGAEGGRSWCRTPSENDFYRLKGIVEAVTDKLGIRGRFVPTSLNFYHPGRQAGFEVEDCQLGNLGELHPDIVDFFDLSGRIYACELNLTALLPYISLTQKYQTLPRYPGIERDLALTVPADVEAAQVTQVISAAAGPYLADIKLFDVYVGLPVPAGYKSFAYSLLFRSADHTLTEEEVNPYLEHIVEQAKNKIGASLRC